MAEVLNLPEYCHPTSRYLVLLSAAFHTCIPTSVALLSTALGIFSIVSWLFAQMPQIFKNFQIQSASGLSIYFLAEWLLGDVTNLLGALLTKQASWQVVVAAYYCTVDVILVSQYFWYSHAKPWRARLVEVTDRADQNRDDESPGGAQRVGSNQTRIGTPKDNTEVDSEDVPNIEPSPSSGDMANKVRSSKYHIWQEGISNWLSEKNTPGYCPRTIRRVHSVVHVPSPRAVLLLSICGVVAANASPVAAFGSFQVSISPSKTFPSEFVGRIVSWISTACYIGSRAPQIYKNFARRSTAGLSPVLFIAAFLGNSFYSASLLSNPQAWSSYPPFGLHGWVGADGSDQTTWWNLSLPFFLGAALVLVMDGIIGVQFLLYGGDEEVLVEDDGKRTHWQAVNGWMRGWIPRPATVEEEQRPLQSRTESRNRGYGAV